MNKTNVTIRVLTKLKISQLSALVVEIVSFNETPTNTYKTNQNVYE